MSTVDSEWRTDFGVELKDCFKEVDNWVGLGIKWLDDIQAFYKERALIEREYSKHLLSLSKKYFDKKAKKSSTVSVGEHPQVTPGSLESASLVTWSGILNETENLARERERLSGDFESQIASQYRQIAAREEELRKRCEGYNTKLVEDRDRVYAELKKRKGKYDDACGSVESSRKKMDSSDGSSRAKVEKHYQQHLLDMNNAKNLYLISINVANAHKHKYYNYDIPELLTNMQSLNESRVRKLNGLWALAAELESQAFDRCKAHLNQLTLSVERNVPNLDSNMFVKHNSGPWSEPADFSYQPCAIWHDDDRLVTDEGAQTFLRNTVAKSKRNLQELQASVDAKKRDVDGLKNLLTAYVEDPKLGNEEEVMSNLITALADVTLVDNKKIALAMEIQTIKNVIGNTDEGNQPHNFKSASFTIPTTCDFCQSTIWGLSKQGYACRDCGYNCHTKCEMKVPASCPGVMMKRNKKKHHEEENGDDELSISRTDTQASSMSASSTTAYGLPKSPSEKKKGFMGSLRHSVGHASTPERYTTPSPPPLQMAKVLYPYTPAGDDEIAVGEGDEVQVVDPDDGSGWMRARLDGNEGLIPASYVEVLPHLAARPASMASSSASKKRGPAVAPKRGAKKLKYVVALYDYDARSDLELTIHEGDKIVMTGADTGDGWMEGELNGIRGSFPSNYVEPA